MRSVEEHLVSGADRLVRLLAPPFESTPKDPGYIKGYVPGVRENGGQYTHAALWVVRAMAELGWRDRAARTLAMLSPISHCGDPESVARNQLEPYVVAADVYGAPPHVGRGGWSWYTGSAGWMYRLILESLLGIARERDRLRFAPCLPASWAGCAIRYRYGAAVYVIAIQQVLAGADETIGAASVSVDGVAQPDGLVRLVDDQSEHRVVVTVRAARA